MAVIVTLYIYNHSSMHAVRKAQRRALLQTMNQNIDKLHVDEIYEIEYTMPLIDKRIYTYLAHCTVFHED